MRHLVIFMLKTMEVITENARRIMKEAYTIENLLLYWYDMIKSFKGIEVE